MRRTNTIADALDQEPPTGKMGYIEAARAAPLPQDDSFVSQVGDYAKTLLKGYVEGVSKLGTMMSPVKETPRFENGKLVLPRSKEEQLQQQTETLDELLPTDEGFVQSSLRRGLNQAPTMTAFPGSGTGTLARSAAAGFLGEGAKELGLPEWAQTAAELTAYIGPDITKKLLESGKDAELIAAAKKFGMSDKQITPLIQSEFKQKWLSKLTPKKGATKKALQDTKEALGDVYTGIQKSEAASVEISEKVNGQLINDLYSKLEQMPRDVQGVIEKDLQDLLSNKITGNTLMNFYKDVNAHLSGNTKQLSLLKEPLKKALGSLSPELAKDFENINLLYSKYYPIASKLKPNLVSDLISAAEAIGILGGITMGHPPSIIAIAGEHAARKLAQQMLLNPHLQQLSKKMVNAMNENKFGVIKKLSQAFSDQIRNKVPEVAEELDKLTEDEIKRFFKSTDQHKTEAIE